MIKDLCFECDTDVDLASHHVVPRSLGGTRTVHLCPKCHAKVHNLKNISHPRLTKEALAKMKANGKRISRTPYGYDLADDGVSLVENAKEQKGIRTMIDLRKQGFSLPRICRVLDMRGFIPKRKHSWGHASVRGILIRNGGDPLNGERGS